MKKEYDFSKGIRGAIDRTSPGKTRITIRLDNEVINWFRSQVELMAGGNYQTMINNVLRDYVSNRMEDYEGTLRRVLNEELSKVHITWIEQNYETADNETLRKDIKDKEIDEYATNPPNNTTHDIRYVN